MMACQFKAFFDATGGLWQSGGLVGKPAGLFFSTGTQRGGQCWNSCLTAITQLTHHGMIYVLVGYTFGPGMFDIENVKGASPYGSGTFAGADGSRQPTETELKQAFHQGQYMARIAKKLKH